MGERAVLVETADTAGTLGLLAALRADPLPHQVELVPGARSLLVRFADPVRPRWVASLAQRSGVAPDSPPSVDPVTLDVVYDGDDLDEVGALTGLGRAGVVTAHTGSPWQVAFCGFSPGFGYLTGGDPRLAVPRRDTPRARVPAGSVALAGEYSGVYPARSPGGWQLIGRTSAVLWDPRREPPALLRPGMPVRFRAVHQAVTGASAGPTAAGTCTAPGTGHRAGGTGSAPTAAPGIDRALIVRRPGMQCTVQDLGRLGVADIGVSPSGAADRGSAMRANRIVGNDPGAAVLEILLGGAEFEARGTLLLAVAGAAVPIEIRGGDGAAHPEAPVVDRPIALSAGARIRLGHPTRGLRSYLAVRGGIDVPPMLGSRSTDTLAGIGPAPLGAGETIPVGADHWGTPHAVPAFSLPDGVELRALPGPQLDWFAPGTLETIGAAEWTVSPASNRVGIRLVGPGVNRVVAAELPSQGLVRGAIQVVPSGELVVFLADHPVTGGYPVVAILTDDSVDLAAQARPGDRVRLRPE